MEKRTALNEPALAFLKYFVPLSHYYINHDFSELTHLVHYSIPAMVIYQYGTHRGRIFPDVIYRFFPYFDG